MTHAAEPPLDPPPRKAHFRRAVRNLRRGYSTMFLLVIFVFTGWAALDAYRWHTLTDDRRILAVAFGLGALLAFLIWRLVDLPLRRELGLARRGEVARGQIVTLRQSRGKRPVVILAYSFQTSTGDTVTGECKLPRRRTDERFAPGAELDILYHVQDPKVNKPRLALVYAEIVGPV